MSEYKTLYDKIWENHLISEDDDGTSLLYVDRHLVHEVTSPQAFEGLRMSNRVVRSPEKTIAVPDHNVPTTVDREEGISNKESRIQVEALDKNAIEIIKVPGAYEIPLAVSKLAKTKRVDGIIALGAVIRGATSHFDYVSSECARGLSEIQSQEGIPVGFGVLMVDTLEQALERAGTKAGNKGEEATLAVIEMVNLLRKID